MFDIWAPSKHNFELKETSEPNQHYDSFSDSGLIIAALHELKYFLRLIQDLQALFWIKCVHVCNWNPTDVSQAESVSIPPPSQHTCHFQILVQTNTPPSHPQILTPFGTHLDQSPSHICSAFCCHDYPAGLCPSGLSVCRCVSTACLSKASASWQAANANSGKNQQDCSCESEAWVWASALSYSCKRLLVKLTVCVRICYVGDLNAEHFLEIECVCLCDKTLQRHMFYGEVVRFTQRGGTKWNRGPPYVITPGIKTLIQTQTVSGLYPNSKLS